MLERCIAGLCVIAKLYATVRSCVCAWRNNPNRRAFWGGARAWCVGLVALFLVGSAMTSRAATILRLTEAQMLEQSSLIVRAKVLYQWSFWTKEQQAIVTQATLGVVSELLGRSAPKRVLVGHYGGTVGKDSMGLEGGPRFVVGEEVVLFLYPNPHIRGEYLLTGWTQGIWKIATPPASFAQNTAEDLRLYITPSNESHSGMFAPSDKPRDGRVTASEQPEARARKMRSVQDRSKIRHTTLREFTLRLRALWALHRKKAPVHETKRQGGGR
ncbi:hypothetical protein L6R29_01660 [Myxococcota bacterium]|nr:hypothetical protein [Myxococcota bacterium]